MEYYLLEECCEILDSKRIPITEKDRNPGEYPYYGANGIQDYVDDYIFDDEFKKHHSTVLKGKNTWSKGRKRSIPLCFKKELRIKFSLFK